MKREIEKKLFQWKNNEHRKPLILQGARQVGKTYILKKFAEREFDNFHYFDLEENKVDLYPIFYESSLDPNEIINKLSFISGKTININSDLLILDEIQSIPRALTALKYFNQNMKALAVAVAGSNLGIASSEEPFPVGEVETYYLYPLNFAEFLEGIREDMSYEFLMSYSGEMISDIYHKRLFEILKLFFITGGLPEVIIEYNRNKSHPIEAFRAVRKLQKQLITHYELDFAKYAGSTNSRHISRIFKAIPAQLACQQNGSTKKFKFKDVITKGNRSYEDLADPIDWLVKAGLALKVNLNNNPRMPLMTAIIENNFKLYMFDIGLLGAMVNLSPESIITYNYGTYKGYFAENFTLQELYTHNFKDIVTWTGKTSEVEFIIEINGRIIPIEVKSGINTKAKSLLAFIDKYKPNFSVKFTGNKFGIDKIRNIYNYPLYLISKFPALSLE